MEDVQEQAIMNRRRRSYTREFKLGVIKYYRKHGESIHRTSDHYKVDRKQVCTGWRRRVNIIGQKKKSKAQRFGKVRYPELEKKLYDELIEKRKEGRIIKKWWIVARDRQIARSEYKTPILKYQTVGSSDFVNDLKFPIEKKLMLLRKVPRNYENQLRCFIKHHRRRGVIPT